MWEGLPQYPPSTKPVGVSLLAMRKAHSISMQLMNRYRYKPHSYKGFVEQAGIGVFLPTGVIVTSIQILIRESLISGS
jgi:hypothetical protein